MIFSGHVCIAYALKTFAWIGRRIRPEDIRMDKWTHSGVCDTPLHGMFAEFNLFFIYWVGLE